MLRYLSKDALQSLLDVLRAAGYLVVGPTIHQEAIVYDRIERVDALPRGWTDEQAPGRYRLKRRDDEALFGYVVGPHSWKKFLFPPTVTLLSSQKTADGWKFDVSQDDPPKLALLGVRACELAAIAIQDKVFAGGDYVDSLYVERRKRLFIIAVNCTQASETCFCVSMGTGPRCKNGFDLAITELARGFIIEVGSDQGAAVIDQLVTRQADEQEIVEADQRRHQATLQSRSLDAEHVHDLLLDNLQHPRWNDVAERCLSCANCTMVCPTCFCSTVQDVSDLTGENVERQRRWDSCFNLDFSYMNGGAVRPQIRSRYRQWLTHKLATWIDQFGTSGCVGCGRCITWCPVGIDITEEVAAIGKKTA